MFINIYIYVFFLKIFWGTYLVFLDLFHSFGKNPVRPPLEKVRPPDLL